MTSLKFFFRAPRLPIIINTGAGLIGAKSWPACKKQLASVSIPETVVSLCVIDATAEGFAYHPEHIAFSPLTLKKRWTKAEIIELYNNAIEPGRPAYPATSLGNKTLAKVVEDIVELLVAEQATRLQRKKPDKPN